MILKKHQSEYRGKLSKQRLNGKSTANHTLGDETRMPTLNIFIQ